MKRNIGTLNARAQAAGQPPPPIVCADPRQAQPGKFPQSREFFACLQGISVAQAGAVRSVLDVVSGMPDRKNKKRTLAKKQARRVNPIAAAGESDLGSDRRREAADGTGEEGTPARLKAHRAELLDQPPPPGGIARE